MSLPWGNIAVKYSTRRVTGERRVGGSANWDRLGDKVLNPGLSWTLYSSPVKTNLTYDSSAKICPTCFQKTPDMEGNSTIALKGDSRQSLGQISNFQISLAPVRAQQVFG